MTYYNLVRFNTSSTGDSDVIVGAAVGGCLTPALAGVSDSEDVEYGLITYSPSTKLPVGGETGLGRYVSSGPTFKRTTVYTSTDSDNSQIDLTGNTQIYFMPTAQYYNNESSHNPVMWHDQSIVTAGNALRTAIDSLSPYNHVVYQDVSADSDEWTNGFTCKAGTYTLKILGNTGTGNGKLDVYIDNVLISSGIDFYAVSLTESVIKSVSNVTISLSGYHTFKGHVNGKNASSTGYDIDITKMWLQPSSY